MSNPRLLRELFFLMIATIFFTGAVMVMLDHITITPEKGEAKAEREMRKTLIVERAAELLAMPNGTCVVSIHDDKHAIVFAEAVV